MTDQTEPHQPPPRSVYARMAVIGGGLIGSSVIRAARAHGAVGARSRWPTPIPAHRTRLSVCWASPTACSPIRPRRWRAPT